MPLLNKRGRAATAAISLGSDIGGAEDSNKLERRLTLAAVGSQAFMVAS